MTQHIINLGINQQSIGAGLYRRRGDDPNAVTLTTTHVGTFNPTMTKTGALPIWTDDQGNAYTGLTPSFSYGGAGTKTIRVTSPDGWSGLSAFFANGLNLTSISANFATLWASVTNFQVSSNIVLAFDIAPLANWRPTQFYAYTTSISGDIAALANWRPTNFYAQSTSISGDIAALANWRPSDFRVFSTSISGDVAALANWRPLGFYAYFTSISGDIAALADWRPIDFRAYSTSITCSGAGGAVMSAQTAMTQYQVQNAQIGTAGLNAIVVDLWTYRAGHPGLTIKIEGNPGVLSADSIDRIEGTGAYAGDGIKQFATSMTY